MIDVHLTLMQTMALAACCALNLALVTISVALRFGDSDERPLAALGGQIIPAHPLAVAYRAPTRNRSAL